MKHWGESWMGITEWELNELNELNEKVNFESKPEIVTLDVWVKSNIIIREKKETHLCQGSKEGAIQEEEGKVVGQWVKGNLVWDEGNKVTRDQFM